MQRFGIAVLLSMIVALLVPACSKKSSSDPTVQTVEDLLLKDNEISGWTRSGSGWVANNDQELFGPIDGAAPDYIQYGFEEGAGQDYSGRILLETATIELWIFDMGTVANASAIFSVRKEKLSSTETWSSAALDTACVERSAVSQTLICTRSRYYIFVSTVSGLTEALEVEKMFASNVGMKID
jgi:hypothetical protein